MSAGSGFGFTADAVPSNLCNVVLALTAQRSRAPLVFLTRLGGGAFGNDDAWIDAAIRSTLSRFRDFALEAVFVSYGPVPPSLRALEGEFAAST